MDVIVHAGRDGSTFKVDEVWFRACPDVMGKSDERGSRRSLGRAAPWQGTGQVFLPARSLSREARPVAAGVLLGGFAGWTAAASSLFVQFGGLGGKLDQPWLAWWLYAVNSPDGWTVALLAASAALPLVFVAAATFAIWRLRSAYDRTFPRPLMGTARGPDSEKQSAGIKQSRSPF